MSPETDNSIVDWIALSFIVGVGSRTAAALIEKFGSPTLIFAASTRSLEAAGVSRESIAAIKNSDSREKAHSHIHEIRRLGAEAIRLTDQSYPRLLRETYDPPIVIYCLGD